MCRVACALYICRLIQDTYYLCIRDILYRTILQQQIENISRIDRISIGRASFIFTTFALAGEMERGIKRNARQVHKLRNVVSILSSRAAAVKTRPPDECIDSTCGERRPGATFLKMYVALRYRPLFATSRRRRRHSTSLYRARRVPAQRAGRHRMHRDRISHRMLRRVSMHPRRRRGTRAAPLGATTDV